MSTIVVKFGGASVASPQHFGRIADIVLKRKKENDRVVVVVSAMGDTTNELLSLAKQVNPSPPQREMDMLVSVGERISASLLAMALDGKGHAAISFTGSQAGIITSNEHAKAEILRVSPYRLQTHLDQGAIVVVAGFQGVSREGDPEITTLGRGGSDTTAVALAHALGASHVEFYKDVSGMYTLDPKKNSSAELLSSLSYDEAKEIVTGGANILSLPCLQLADQHGIALHIYSFFHPESGPGTRITKNVAAYR
jgi:aspartate kinase